MNNTEQTSTTRKLRRASVFAVHIAILGSLAACTESPFPDNSSAIADSQSSDSSATNQTHDGSEARDPAQDLAASETPPSVVDNLPLPITGAARPDPVPVVPNPFTPAPAPAPEPAATKDPAEEPATDNTDEQVSDSGASSESSTDTATDVDPTVDSEADPAPAAEDNTSEPSNTNETDNKSSTTEETDPPVSALPEEAGIDDAEHSTDNSDGENSLDNGAETDPADPGDVGESKSSSETVFTSQTTAGFSAEIIDNSIHITWEKDPDALGYNVYLEGKYVVTVWENSYIETDLFDRDYYYEIQAFDQTKTIYYYVATGLTVPVRTTGRIDATRAKANPDLLQDYELIFSDEFNGNSLDTSKWETSFLWGDDVFINGEVQFYVDIKNKPDFGFNPFTFDGENLIINSIKTPVELLEKSEDQPYLSGIITSYEALQFIYGYVETRAKVTHGKGYWPAFWLLNSYYGQGGDDPEIDIMEFIGHDQDVVYHTYHYYDANGELRSTKSQPTPGIDYTSDFHTFAVEWKPGTIIYFVDGIEVHRVTDPKVSQQSMYVIANTALGGWWAGNPDETTPFPGEFVIDYIRVYQRNRPYDDVLFNDDMTDIPFADDIPGSAIPNHRPTREQWPEGYPHAQ